MNHLSMDWVVRSIAREDLPDLKRLSQQEILVSIPPDETILSELIEKSLTSFASPIPRSDAKYIFVLENLTEKRVVGVSLVYAAYASEENPYYCLKLFERKTVDPELGLCVKHELMQIEVETEPFSLTGGLILDRRFRGHPQKLGKQISLIRFLYMGLFPERFQGWIRSEVVAPLTADGRNRFWDVVGEPLTGLSFEHFLALDRMGERCRFGRLFPTEPIFLCFLPPELRLSAERVRGENGRVAKQIIENIGFRFLNRMHLHGGPILGTPLREVSLIREGGLYVVAAASDDQPGETVYIAKMEGERFIGAEVDGLLKGQAIVLKQELMDVLRIKSGDTIFLSRISPEQHGGKI